MSAAEAMKAARAAGISLRVDGDDLVLEAPAAPPATVLDALSRHKADVVSLLRPAADGWSAADWRAYFDERAGIAEFEGGLAREAAEARAFACCVCEWLIQNPASSQPGRCAWCGSPERPGTTILPFGAPTSGHVWLHARCWEEWHRKRESEAGAALAAMDIRSEQAGTSESTEIQT